MIKNKKYKDAAMCAGILQLQNTFDDPKELLMPLVLQDKINLAEDFMKNQPEIQIKFVSYLDNLSSNSSVANYIDQYVK